MNPYFTTKRFWLMLKLELFNSRKAIMMTFIITFGMLFFVGFLLDMVLNQSIVIFDHKENFAGSLLVAGFVLSSLAFNGLGSSLKRIQFLTLPVSALERFLSMWLLTNVGWIVLFTVIYTLYAMMVNAIGPLIFNHISFEYFDPFGQFSLKVIACYFVLQGLFLTGSAHFGGYALPKTLVVLVLFGSICALLIYFILRGVFMTEHECSGYDCSLIQAAGIHPVWMLAKGLFWYVLAPLSWFIAYLGLKEQEV